MRKKQLGAALAAALLLIPLHSQASSRKDAGGVYAALELSAGSVIDGSRGLVTPDYALKMAAGWRFSPTVAVAAGFEGISSVKAGCTSLPLLVQVRWDLSERRVRPYIQAELGYAFQLPQGNLGEGDILENAGVFTDRLGGLSLGDYLSAFPESRRDAVMDGLTSFSNGSRSYIDGKEWGRRLVSKDGVYGNVTAGIALSTGGSRRSDVFFGVTAGVASYYEGLYVMTEDRGRLRYGVLEQMPPDGSRPKGRTAVTEGRPGGWGARYRAEVRFKVGFSF